jgi:hypothetical protein
MLCKFKEGIHIRVCFHLNDAGIGDYDEGFEARSRPESGKVRERTGFFCIFWVFFGGWMNYSGGINIL